MQLVPDCHVVLNMVPKEYAMSDIYSSLVPNADPNQLCYQIVPRIGAFEVSFNGFLLISKLQYRMWPSVSLVAGKCQKAFEAHSLGKELAEFQSMGNCVRKSSERSRKSRVLNNVKSSRNNQLRSRDVLS